MFKFLWKLIKGIFALVLLLVVVVIAYTFLKPEEKETYREVKWPDSELATMIPEVGENGTFTGKIDIDSSDSLSIIVGNVEGSDFDSYVSACKDKGFTVDYSSSSESYSADDQNGYSLFVEYNEKKKTMDILLHALKEEETNDQNNEQEPAPTPTPEPTTESAEAPATEKVTEAPAEAAVSDDQIRPEFKEAMDSYEAFFDEYVDFMKKYSDSGSPVTMALDYADYLKKYTEMMNKMDELGEEEMTTAELGYYAEVTGRITQKLGTVVTE